MESTGRFKRLSREEWRNPPPPDMRPLYIKHGQDFDKISYRVEEIIDKEEFFKKHYPFAYRPKLLDVIECVHCSRKYRIIHFRTDNENRILCPDPNCDGTVADWIK